MAARAVSASMRRRNGAPEHWNDQYRMQRQQSPVTRQTDSARPPSPLFEMPTIVWSGIVEVLGRGR